MKRLFASLSLSFLLLSCANDADSPSKDEIRDNAIREGKADDSTDWCEIMGWYGDGVCDEFCASPDPDCAGSDGCFIGGCSSQVCSDQPNVITTCEIQGHYACFQDATCERQADGNCGWTEDTELVECLESFLGECHDGVLQAGAGHFVPSADGMECQLPSTHCLTNDASACPQIQPVEPGFCQNGTVVQGPPTFISSADGKECELPNFHCLTNDASACPQIEPLHPGFCPDGTAVQGPPTFVDSADGMECEIPSVHCVTSDASACPQF
jgi:hypothetical protein